MFFPTVLCLRYLLTTPQSLSAAKSVVKDLGGLVLDEYFGDILVVELDPSKVKDIPSWITVEEDNEVHTL